MTWEELTAGVQRACVSTFGATAAPFYRPGGGVPGYTLPGIFRAAHAEIETGERTKVTSARPTLHVRRADMQADPAVDDEVDVHGASYQVKDRQPDGEGMLTLVLKLLP